MEKDRQTKIIAIVALLVGVATLTLGFATFSTKLIVQSQATVSPDPDSFKVVLSKEQDKEVVGKVLPNGIGESAMIDNTGTPTISNLKAEFTKPGEKVEYEFYAVNIGELDAFLNKIEYNNITGKSENKVCTAEDGTTESYVAGACESIRVTIKVGDDDRACQTSTYGTHRLVKKTGEKVSVVIEYDNSGVRADGPFSVEFGDITLNYSTVDNEAKDVAACDAFATSFSSRLDINNKTSVEDVDGDGKISIGDKVYLESEGFYVINTDEFTGNVDMLAEWNLNVGYDTIEDEPLLLQSSKCLGRYEGESEGYCTYEFSTEKYWSAGNEYIYNEQSDIYEYINYYVEVLKEAGFSSVEGRLIKVEELDALGCKSNSYTCADAPSWVRNTSFWTGTSASWGTRVMRYIRPDYVYSSNAADADELGIRPVIAINATDIK